MSFLNRLCAAVATSLAVSACDSPQDAFVEDLSNSIRAAVSQLSQSEREMSEGFCKVFQAPDKDTQVKCPSGSLRFLSSTHSSNLQTPGFGNEVVTIQKRELFHHAGPSSVSMFGPYVSLDELVPPSSPRYRGSWSLTASSTTCDLWVAPYLCRNDGFVGKNAGKSFALSETGEVDSLVHSFRDSFDRVSLLAWAELHYPGGAPSFFQDVKDPPSGTAGVLLK